jgi:radical SAM superfamily enzyme YgiQ (UPF0313 family)
VKILFLESGVTAPERFVYQCYPPHGLMYLASCLRQKRPGHELRLYDMMALRARPADADAMIRSFGPDLVAIHAMSFQASCMHAVAALVKAANPRAVVAVGGPHASAAPESVLRDKNVDVIGLGEGEETFAEIVERVEAGASLAGIAGTAAVHDHKIVRGPERAFSEDLDRIPFPAWDLVDLKQYFTDVMLTQNDITFRREVSTIFTSRACPFRCIFCHNMFGKKFRARSVENVLAEMEELCRLGIRELHVIDDCFNFNTERAVAILEGIRERGLDLKLAFPNGIRGDRLPDQLLAVMKKAGVYKINIGIESGSPRVQKVIKKGLSLDAIRDGIARAASRGIFTHGFFMMGFPDETEEDLRATIDFACSSDLHTAGFALLSPFPGTEVYRMAAAAGKKVEFDPDDSSYSRLAVNLTEVDDQTLLKMHRRAHWKFYGSPQRLYRIVNTMPHPLDLVKVGIKHFRLKFL